MYVRLIGRVMQEETRGKEFRNRSRLRRNRVRGNVYLHVLEEELGHQARVLLTFEGHPLFDSIFSCSVHSSA